MNWKLWHRKKENPLEKKLLEINTKVEWLMKHQQELPFAEIEGSLLEHSEQMQRLSRLQYKAGQDAMKRLDSLQASLQDLSVVCSTGNESIKIAALENQLHAFAGTMIQWIDHVDILLYSPAETVSAEWQRFLANLSTSLLTSLETAGITEYPLLGTSFNTHFAEAVETISPHQLEGPEKPRLPYEIIQVLQRAFLLADGRVLRKGRVVTVATPEQK